MFSLLFGSAIAVTYGTIILMLVIFLYILPVIITWKILQKAGIEGWKSLIPIYNLYLMFEICEMPGWYVFPILITFISECFMESNSNLPLSLDFILLVLIIFSAVIEIKFAISLGKHFGKSDGFIVGIIFLPHIFKMIIAFDLSTYQKVCSANTNNIGQNNTDYTETKNQDDINGEN